MLENEGDTVSEASSGEEGCKRYSEQPTDLIITDLVMLIWLSKKGHTVKRLLPKQNYSQNHLGFYTPRMNGDDGYYKTFRYT